MTLADLLEELVTFRPSARMARVVVRVKDEDFDILSAQYESGEVVIMTDDEEPEDD